MNVGGVNLHVDQMALGVGEDVAFAAFDHLAGIEAPRPAALGGLHGLAVGDPGSVAATASEALTQGHDQHLVERGQQAPARPGVEVAL
jgi:hypothetical protein